MTGQPRKKGAVPFVRKQRAAPLPDPVPRQPSSAVLMTRCSTCEGNGELYVTNPDGSIERTINCWTCHGEGYSKVLLDDPPEAKVSAVMRSCEWCGGSGVRNSPTGQTPITCSWCGGRGITQG